MSPMEALIAMQSGSIVRNGFYAPRRINSKTGMIEQKEGNFKWLSLDIPLNKFLSRHVSNQDWMVIDE